MKRLQRLTLIVLFMAAVFVNLAFGGFSDKVFAPYVDVLLYPRFSINYMQTGTGQNYYTLAFIISDTECKPSWGGVIPIDDNYYKDEIDSIREKGGDVIVSFGGANGKELALCLKDAEALQAEYQYVIDKYNLTWVDFDIEGWAVSDSPSIDLRNKAIVGLQATNPGLKVAFCLPVLPSGLTQDGIYVLENAISNGVRIDIVNIMAMDYGDWAAPNPEGQMGQYAIDAANNTYQQIQSLGLNSKIGVTPMIGQNDVQSERFYVSDAGKLLNWASSNNWVSMLSMWSANRDNGNCSGQVYASPLCSGVEQTEFEFTKTFMDFSTGSGNIYPRVSIVSPLNNASFDEGELVTIEAEAYDSDGSIAKVEFFMGADSIGVDMTAPYSVVLNDAPKGLYSLSALVTDDMGATAKSASVKISIGEAGCSTPLWDSSKIYLKDNAVSHNSYEWRAKWWTRGEEPGTTGQWGVWEKLGLCGGNISPTAIITAPLGQAAFDQGEQIVIEADCYDSDGFITKVEFFSGADLLGTASQTPYIITWTDALQGVHSLTAVATDNLGLTGVSIPVQITVGSQGCTSPPWDSSKVYWEGDRASHNGRVWRAKWWTLGEEPGTTGQWGVWEDAGSCM